MKYNNLIKFTIPIFLVESLSAESVLLYKNYLNQSYSSSKSSLMVGATTATAKGYGAILSNPAGLTTNANMAIYAKSVFFEIKDKDNVTINEIELVEQISAGILYDSFALEYKLEDYVVGGLGYGFESKYGLFSVGASYLFDITDRDAEGVLASDEFATGNYNTVGAMWQKTFVNPDDFYSIYIGFSRKSSSQYTGGGNEKIIPISPEKFSYGLGLETNIFKTSLLVTMDISQESWKSSKEVLDSTAYALKWLITEKLAISGGIATQTFSGSILKDTFTMGGGLEFGFLGAHINVSYSQRDVNDMKGNLYLTQGSTHVDVVLAF